MEFDEENPLSWLKWGLAILAIAGVLTFAGIGIKILLFPATVAGEVIDAKKAISGYEWYHAQYAEVNATVSKINGFFKMHPGDQFTNVDRITVDGMIQYLEGICGDYNGRSKMTTRALWKEPSLPYQLLVVYGKDSISIEEGAR